jgi:hypothetical protein
MCDNARLHMLWKHELEHILDNSLHLFIRHLYDALSTANINQLTRSSYLPLFTVH